MMGKHWLCELLGHKFKYFKPWFVCERCGYHFHNPYPPQGNIPPPGVIDHNVLLNVTANQHHPQLHAATHVSGGADDLGTITRHVTVPALELGVSVAYVPTANRYGITGALEFTDDQDKAYHLFHLPTDWKSGTDLLVHFHWTRSSTGAPDNGKTVKWQVKYLVVDGVSENCNYGEATLSVQDTYLEDSFVYQVVYKTDDVTIPAAALAAGDLIILEVMAITPTGTALSEPALVGLGFSYTANLAPT